MIALLLIPALVFCEDCQPGLLYTRYYNEVEFINPAETKVIDTLRFEGYNYGYNSILITGSFCPKKNGTYHAKIFGRPFCQLYIEGYQKSPPELGPAANCWAATQTTAYIDDLHFDSNRCYYIEVSARTGCTLFGQYLKLSFWRDGEPEYYPGADEYLTCHRNDCVDGYYGEHCENQCKAEVIDRCKEHGFCFNGTSGNGDCVCDDHYEGYYCNESITPIDPAEPDSGLQMVSYHDEIGFTDPFYNEYRDQAIIDGIGYIFCSIRLLGSIMPERSGEYKFRIIGKPHAQFNFMGTHTPGELGPAGSCDNSIVSDYETQVFHLDRHHTYPFEISYRSGCGLIYDKRIHLMWKNGPKYGDVNAAPWENVPAYVFFRTQADSCVPTTYGSDCESICKDCEAISDHYTCDQGISGSGQCVCKNPNVDCFCSEKEPCLNGGECDMASGGICKCPEGYYGEHCERYCDDFDTCHNHGQCNSLGYCECQDDYVGDTCILKCDRKNYCNDHGDCQPGGVCQCDENWTGNTCSHHVYQPSPNEMEQGLELTMFNDEFWSGGWAEAPHVEPTINRPFDHVLYKSVKVTGALVSYNKTKAEVRVRARPFGQIRLNHRTNPTEIGPAGTCLQFDSYSQIDEFTLFPNKLYDIELYYRSGCSLIPQLIDLQWRPRGQTEWTTIPQEHLRANKNGQTCLERYSGVFCNEYCDADCNLHGDCVIHDNQSTCQCFDGYYGDHCQYTCDPEVDCNGHGVCYDNTCICDALHSGDHCQITCQDATTCNGHGNCEQSESGDYACYCDDGYEGETCAQHTYIPSPNETLHGVTFTMYTNENFTNVKTGYPITVNNYTMTFTPLMFNSATFNAAIVTTSRISGRIRFFAKPYGQISFNGLYTLPHEIGPSYSCWATTVTNETTPKIDFIPNKLYHLNLSYKSGCSFFEQKILLEWQLGNGKWEPIPEKNIYIPKSYDQQCLDRYSGDNCNQYCSLDCNQKGICEFRENSDEMYCKCFDGTEGATCANSKLRN